MWRSTDGTDLGKSIELLEPIELHSWRQTSALNAGHRIDNYAMALDRRRLHCWYSWIRREDRKTENAFTVSRVKSEFCFNDPRWTQRRNVGWHCTRFSAGVCKQTGGSMRAERSQMVDFTFAFPGRGKAPMLKYQWNEAKISCFQRTVQTNWSERVFRKQTICTALPKYSKFLLTQNLLMH